MTEGRMQNQKNQLHRIDQGIGSYNGVLEQNFPKKKYRRGGGWRIDLTGGEFFLKILFPI